MAEDDENIFRRMSCVIRESLNNLRAMLSRTQVNLQEDIELQELAIAPPPPPPPPPPPQQLVQQHPQQPVAKPARQNAMRRPQPQAGQCPAQQPVAQPARQNAMRRPQPQDHQPQQLAQRHPQQPVAQPARQNAMRRPQPQAGQCPAQQPVAQPARQNAMRRPQPQDHQPQQLAQRHPQQPVAQPVHQYAMRRPQPQAGQCPAQQPVAQPARLQPPQQMYDRPVYDRADQLPDRVYRRRQGPRTPPSSPRHFSPERSPQPGPSRPRLTGEEPLQEQGTGGECYEGEEGEHTEEQDPDYLPLREEVYVLLEDMDPNDSHFYYYEILAGELNNEFDNIPSYDDLREQVMRSQNNPMRLAVDLLKKFYKMGYARNDHYSNKVELSRCKLQIMEEMAAKLFITFIMYKKELRETYGQWNCYPEIGQSNPLAVVRRDDDGTYVDLRFGFERLMQAYRSRITELEWMDPRKRRQQLDMLGIDRQAEVPSADEAMVAMTADADRFMETAYEQEDLMVPELEERIDFLENRLREFRRAERNRPADDSLPYDYEKLVRAMKRKICQLKKLLAANRNVPNRQNIRILESFPDSDEE